MSARTASDTVHRSPDGNSTRPPTGQLGAPVSKSDPGHGDTVWPVGSSGPTIELTLPARPESVTVVRQALTGIADTDDWHPAFLADLKIAVSEACANVVVHAYPDNDDGLINVAIFLGGERVIVQVADDGVGMSPRIGSPAAGLGLGLPLMAALSDEVQVRTAQEGATEVQMSFTVSVRGEPARNGE